MLLFAGSIVCFGSGEVSRPAIKIEPSIKFLFLSFKIIGELEEVLPICAKEGSIAGYLPVFKIEND